MSKGKGTGQSWGLPAGWLHRLALFLVLVLLVLYVGALLAHLLGDTSFYVTREADLYQMAVSILGVLVWVTAMIVVLVAFQWGHPLAVEPWRRWPWISRAVAVLAAAALLKHVAILVTRASPAAAMHLETVTLLLRVGGWALVALGLLRGEEPLADVLGAKMLRKDKG